MSDVSMYFAVLVQKAIDRSLSAAEADKLFRLCKDNIELQQDLVFQLHTAQALNVTLNKIEDTIKRQRIESVMTSYSGRQRAIEQVRHQLFSSERVLGDHEIEFLEEDDSDLQPAGILESQQKGRTKNSLRRKKRRGPRERGLPIKEVIS